MAAINPKLDLVLERTTEVSPGQIWKALTQPESLKLWFCPRPWKVTEAEMDVFPGGIFRTVFNGPNGETHSNMGCYLEIVPGKKLVWTSGLGPGFRPAVSNGPPDFTITAIIELIPNGTGTRYVATVLHSDEASREAHEKMGFQQGWGIAFDQMIEVIKGG